MVPNFCNRWGDGDAYETGATTESMVSNLLHPSWQVNVFQIFATTKNPFLNLFHPFGKSDIHKVFATRESTPSYLFYPLRKFHARELFAILERLLLYLCLPFGYDGLAILDVVAVFLVSCHDDSLGALVISGCFRKQILSFGILFRVLVLLWVEAETGI